MSKIKNHPFILLAGFITMLSLYFDKALAVQMHDTYIVIGFKHLCFALSILLISIGMPYVIINHLLESKILKAAHIISTHIGMFFILFPALRQIVDPNYKHEPLNPLNGGIGLGIIIIMLSLIFLILNILITSFSKTDTSIE